jgi:hypothetical protein
LTGTSGGELVLGGDLKAHFAFGTPEEQAQRLEAARAEQEAMAGYPLQVASVRQTHYIDKDGKDVYEVWATFSPVEHTPAADTNYGEDIIGLHK